MAHANQKLSLECVATMAHANQKLGLECVATMAHANQKLNLQCVATMAHAFQINFLHHCTSTQSIACLKSIEQISNGLYSNSCTNKTKPKQTHDF